MKDLYATHSYRLSHDMKRIVDVPSVLDKKIQDLVRTHGYKDFQQFATIALENQIIWETGSSEESNAAPNRVKAAGIDQNLIRTTSMQPLLLPAPSPENLTGKILWGQYYRFLPSKVGVRILSNISAENFPTLHDFLDTATAVGTYLQKHLSKLDKTNRKQFGERLSASFPTADEKSARRFANQYMLYLRTSDMRLVGMMADLKFVNIKVEEGEIVRAGLTKFGMQFAQIQNPVLDLNKPEPLSQEEREFLLEHISKNLPVELEHMSTVLQTIREGKKGNEELNSVLKDYYQKYHGGSEWSDAVIKTMRSGLLSRMNELGLVRREKRGKNVFFHITSTGQKSLGRLQYV